jgi:hydrogenase nickel incorporation protein HypA/HybF
MHEASLTRGLVRTIEEIAAREGATRVVGIEVWLGALSHMSKEHLAEHFAQAAAGTIAEGAALRVSVSDDPAHSDAQDIRLESVELET